VKQVEKRTRMAKLETCEWCGERIEKEDIENKTADAIEVEPGIVHRFHSDCADEYREYKESLRE